MFRKIIAFDLDDVLCFRDPEAKGKVDKYKTCYPNTNMIEVANRCKQEGYRIIIYTARGMTGFNGDISKIYSNLYELTKSQLKDWGVNYDQLIMGKAHYDLLIDDKAINSLLINSKKDVEQCLN